MGKYKFSETEIETIIHLYEVKMLGTPTIGNRFNVSKGVINRLLKKHGVKMGKSGRKFKGGKTASDKRYRDKPKNKERQKRYMEMYSPEYYKNNKDKISEYGSEYRKNNKEKERSRHREYYLKNKEKINNYRERYKDRRSELHKEKMNSDPLYKLTHNVRTLIKQTFKRYGKNSKTQEILGCSFDEFKNHIESQWEDWMCWGNYGNPEDGIYEPNKTWDIDHIVPSSTALTEEDVIRLNHYTNLQPLCSYTNRFIKKDK